MGLLTLDTIANCFVCLLLCYLFYFINADTEEDINIPKTGKFKKAPSIIEKNRSNEIVRGMRTFWFEHTIKMIRKMTHEILIDANTKMYFSEMLKKKFQHSITYQLGSTAASIMDEFESMLVTYRRYANITTFKKERALKKYDLRSFSEAFLTIQGLYHQIRVEEHIFNSAVERLINKRMKVKRAREKAGILRSRDNEQNTLRTRDNQQNTLPTRDNQQNIIRSRDNQQNILQTRDNQQNILWSRDSQQNTNRGSKPNTFGRIIPEESLMVSYAREAARQHNAKQKSVKKPLWVYKEAEEDN